MNRQVQFVSCTRGRREPTQLHQSRARLAPSPVRFFEDNAAGLPLRYNAVLDQAAGSDQIVAFVHDDIAVLDESVVPSIVAAAERFVVIGIAGSPDLMISDDLPTTWFQPSRASLSGRVEHSIGGSVVVSDYGPAGRPCVVLDGLVIAVDMRRIGSVRFDPRFDFHFYDLDFCLSARAAGLPIGTADLHLRHFSGGNFSSPRYSAGLDRFRAKWPAGAYTLDETVLETNRNALCRCGSGLRYKHCHGRLAARPA
jgi:hypothetical protein